MTLVQKLKAESLRLRKERNPIAASITFVLSEIEKVGKNAGNRETTEDEAIKVVQKLIATIDQNIAALQGLDDGRAIAFNYEKQILSSVLPQMVSVEELKEFILAECLTDKKGDAMKKLKTKFGALVDMKLAGTMLDSVVATPIEFSDIK